MRGKRWTDEEKALLAGDMVLSELVTALPHRTQNALRTARSLYFPMRSNKQRKIPTVRKKKVSSAVPWSAEEVELLKTDKPSKVILPLLHKSRTAWSVSYTRHRLGLEVPRIGRPKLSPADFPGADWSLPVGALKRSIGVAWVTAAKLQRMALGGADDG